MVLVSTKIRKWALPSLDCPVWTLNIQVNIQVQFVYITIYLNSLLSWALNGPLITIVIGYPGFRWAIKTIWANLSAFSFQGRLWFFTLEVFEVFCFPTTCRKTPPWRQKPLFFSPFWWMIWCLFVGWTGGEPNLPQHLKVPWCGFHMTIIISRHWISGSSLCFWSIFQVVFKSHRKKTPVQLTTFLDLSGCWSGVERNPHPEVRSEDMNPDF